MAPGVPTGGHPHSLWVICEPLAWAEEPCPQKNPVHLGCLSRPTLQGGLERGLGAGQLPKSKGAMSRGDPGPLFYWGPVRLLLCLLGCGAALGSGAGAAGTRPGGREELGANHAAGLPSPQLGPRL